MYRLVGLLQESTARWGIKKVFKLGTQTNEYLVEYPQEAVSCGIEAGMKRKSTFWPIMSARMRF